MKVFIVVEFHSDWNHFKAVFKTRQQAESYILNEREQGKEHARALYVHEAKVR